MPFGYAGKILWVDLTHVELREEPIERYQEWVGGRGLGSFLLFRHQEPDSSPDGEFIIIAAGPLVAVIIAGTISNMILDAIDDHYGLTNKMAGWLYGTQVLFAQWKAVGEIMSIRERSTRQRTLQQLSVHGVGT